MTTKCGHLRPQNLIFTDRANKTSTVHGVTCDHRMRSLTTTKHFHNRRTEGGWIIQGREGGGTNTREGRNNTREGTIQGKEQYKGRNNTREGGGGGGRKKQYKGRWGEGGGNNTREGRNNTREQMDTRETGHGTIQGNAGKEGEGGKSADKDGGGTREQYKGRGGKGNSAREGIYRGKGG